MITRRLRHGSSALLLALVVSCKGATSEQPTQTVADVRALIVASNAEFSRLTTAGQADSIAALYHDDATLMISHAPAATGRAAISATFAGLFGNDVRATLTTTDVTLADSIAVERGTFLFLLRNKADTTQVLATDTGNYVVEWRKRQGAWKMHWDIAATDVPMPAMAAPAAPAESHDH